MPGDILVINAGSSSVKVALFEWTAEGPTRKVNAPAEATTDFLGHALASRPAAIGHRIVHGGVRHAAPVRIDPEVRAYLQSIVPLAPLHQPANLAGIDAAATAFPGVPQVACFDTAFHQGKPFVADAFALPGELYDQGVRRYGFHGLSYEYIVRAMRRVAPKVANGRLIVCHLGNGASMCAIREGKCIETTMSFTALDGLAMGTRCGQLDPGVILYLLEEQKKTVAEVNELLYRRSGLLGLSGISSDLRDLLASSDPRAARAIEYFVHRIACSAGSLAVALGGVDGLVFTAGIGEHATLVRERVCQKLAWLGIDIDPEANASHALRLSTAGAKVSVWVVPTDEEKMIAWHVGELLGK